MTLFRISRHGCRAWTDIFYMFTFEMFVQLILLGNIGYIFFYGVHPLRMTMTSSSSLNMAEVTNAWEALSATKGTQVSRIVKWAEHCCMLVAATVSDRCSSIVFSVKS